MQIKVDDHHTHRRRAMICLIGNVSQLTGQHHLIPGAAPDDGLLDVYVASPHRFTHWFRVFLRLITRRRHGRRPGRPVAGQAGRGAAAASPTATSWTATWSGRCRTLVAEIQPGALTVCVPDATAAG